MSEISRFQEGKIAEKEWRDKAEAQSNLKGLQQEINQAHGGDIFKIPATDLPRFREAAQRYLDVAGQEPGALAQLAKELVDLPEPEKE